MTTTTEPRTGSPDHLTPGTIAPGTPKYLYAVNPWLPWCNRIGGIAIGTVLAAGVTGLLGSPLRWWAAAAAVAAALLFAWVVAGHELHEKRPKTFTEAP